MKIIDIWKATEGLSLVSQKWRAMSSGVYEPTTQGILEVDKPPFSR